MLKLLIGAAVTLLLLLSPLASASPQPHSTPAVMVAQMAQPSPETVLERLFTSPTLQADWFADTFLSQVSLAQVEQIVRGVQQTLGPYQRVQSQGQNYLIVFERGTIVAQLSTNATGQITGLLFQRPQLTDVSLEELVPALQALPGQASLLVLKEGAELIRYNADKPLAVGSAFKLLVLQALRQQIEAGEHQWDEVVQLQPEWKSLPSGILQTWPPHTPITLQSLATLMISLSDNTATDALIDITGRQSLEELSPRNQPFLTTKELFILKNPENAALLQRYRRAELGEQRRILEELQTYPLPGVDLFNGGEKSLALDIEWFLTAKELCAAIATVADLPLMQIEPGLADPAEWAQAAFKGGSEPGVLNFTTQVQAKDGTTYCIAATWNNPEGVDQTQFATLVQSAIAALHHLAE